MIPQIGVASNPWNPSRHKGICRYLFVSKPTKNTRPRVSSPDVVDENADFDTSFLCCRQLDPSDIEARGRMQLGACFGGMAIESSMLGAAHALANPLTAKLGVAHGQAVGLMMPHVIRFNSQVVEESYMELVSLLPRGTASDQRLSASDNIANIFTQWMRQASLATTLESLPQWPAAVDSGQSDALLRELANSASKQWTVSFNPRPAAESDLLAIYRAACTTA